MQLGAVGQNLPFRIDYPGAHCLVSCPLITKWRRGLCFRPPRATSSCVVKLRWSLIKLFKTAGARYWT